MKKLMIAFVALSMIVPASTAAGLFGWSVSSSLDDPCVNTGVATWNVQTLYLWYTYEVGTAGLASASADPVTDGALSLLAFTPMNGFLHCGACTELLLAVGGCPPPPIVAGNFLIFDGPGSICMNMSENAYDCDLNIHANASTGYSSWDDPCVEDGGVPGADGCNAPPISVAGGSWGMVKSLYR